MKLSVSILSMQHDDDIKQKISKLNNCSIDYLHLDIMDGKFVKNVTWNAKELMSLLPADCNNLDVHLMVDDVKKYISEFSLLNPKYITFQLEAVSNLDEVINLIKKKNIGVGIALKPNTSLDCLKPYLKLVDLVLVMSVEPGLGGQQFMNSSIEKIDELFRIRQEKKYSYVIEVDGGVNDKTISYCKNCDIVVVGSYITNGDYEERIKNLKIK